MKAETIKSMAGRRLKLGKYMMEVVEGDSIYDFKLDRLAFRYVDPIPRLATKFVYIHSKYGTCVHTIYIDYSKILHIGCYRFDRATTKKILKWAGISV